MQSIEIPLTKGYTTFIDVTDADLAKYKWHSKVKERGIVYAVRWLALGPKRRRLIFLHQVILERILNRSMNPGELVDHRDNDGLNNRRGNLRLADLSTNGFNARTRSHSKSGIKGVYHYKNRWKAYIRKNGRRVHLGSFTTPEEASAAYLKAAVEIAGEFARSK